MNEHAPTRRIGAAVMTSKARLHFQSIAMLNELEFTGDQISNSGPNVVMLAYVSARFKDGFGDAQLVLAVEFAQIAEIRSLELDCRCYALPFDLLNIKPTPVMRNEPGNGLSCIPPLLNIKPTPVMAHARRLLHRAARVRCAPLASR